MVAGLVDQNGNPILREVLAQELAVPEASGVRRVIEDAVASGLTPERLAMILRQSANGDGRAYLTLAEEMEERYLHYASQLQTRRLAVEGIEVSVEIPDGVPAKIGDAVQEIVNNVHFDTMAGSLLDGIAKGFSVSEIMWDYFRGLLRPAEFKWRDPRFFTFDRLSLSELRLATNASLDGEELPPAKFIRHLPRSKGGIPLRRGLARPAGWGFLIQSFGLKDWAAFAEIYGIPIRVGKYHPHATADDRATLLRAVRNIASDAAAIIPIGMEFEFQKVEGQHGAAVFGGLIDYIDKQISKLVLGQTMTADDGASMAQAKVHNEVRIDIVRADGKQLGQTINRDLIEPFVAMNFGPQDVYPQVAFPVAEPEDVEALTKSVASLVPFGFRVSQQQLREKLGLSKPKDDEELLIAPDAAPAADPTKVPPKVAVTSAHVPGCACTSCKRPASLSADLVEDDGVADVEALMATMLEEWEEITDPLLGPLQLVLANAGSFDEALAMLRAKAPDSAPLAEALARATAIARGIGDVKD